MANQCVDMVETYLDQLRDEGCKLIQWSDDLKHKLPTNSSTSAHNVDDAPPDGKQNVFSPFANHTIDTNPLPRDLLTTVNKTYNNYKNFNNLKLNYLDTSQLAKEFPLLANQHDAQRLLLILYNNYKFVLKKYEELNEQKLSYIEGLKEYQYKLDNSNYLIQLQRSQLASLTNVAPANSDLAANSGAPAASWLNKEQVLLNRERELLRLREEELNSKEKEISSREESIRSREEALLSKQLEVTSKEETLLLREEELASKELELTDKENNLSIKESEFANRERSLAEHEEILKGKQDELFAKEKLVNGREEFLRGTNVSISVEEQGELSYNSVKPHTNDRPNGDNSDDVDKGTKSTEDNSGTAKSVHGASNTAGEDEIDNEAIDSIYIQNMNSNNDNMYVLKKNLFNMVSLKSCTVRIEDNSLLFKIKSTPFKLPLKEITRIHFGEESHSCQIHNKKNKSNEHNASCYFTIHTQSNKNINMYCDNEHNIRTWRTGLNRVLLKQNAQNILNADAPSVPPSANGLVTGDHASTTHEANRDSDNSVE